MLGPGTNITHAAIKTATENGCMIVWCGENCARFYASGQGETKTENETGTEAFQPEKQKEQITIWKSPSSVKAKAKKNKVIVTWKKLKKNKKGKKLLGQIRSIQVQYSTDPNFEQNPVTRELGKKKAKVLLAGLQRQTIYFVRVRYVGDDGISNWSKVKRVRTK